MTEAKTDALDACPQCGSTDRNIRQILRHPTEDASCFNPWHDSPKPGAPTGGFVSDQVYPGPSCARCGAEMAYHCNACEEATEAEPSASEPGKLHRLARAHWDRQKKAIGSEPIDDALIADSMAVFAELHTAAQAEEIARLTRLLSKEK